jgi:hypothetical protein
MMVILENTSTWGKTCPSSTFVFHKSLIAWPGNATGPHSAMRMTHGLRYGTALLKAGNSSESYSRIQFLLHREHQYFHYESQSINAVYGNNCLFFFLRLDIPLLGAFAKLWKATISFVMSVRLSMFPSVRPHGTPRFPHDEFKKKNWYLSIFWKHIEKI